MHHPGELEVQRRVGVTRTAHGSATIGNTIPAVAAQFLLEQPMIVLSGESDGSIWTTALAGAPGFVHAVGDTTVHVDATLPAEDPLHGAFAAPRPIGMIAMDTRTRRRMRINGLAEMGPRGLVVQTEQVVANCPKYIQTRTHEQVDLPPVAVRSSGRRLSEGQIAWIRSADTFFVGTGASGLGLDASHRGGNPGFIEVAPDRLTWPDYLGNSMYLTFGNLEIDARVGLLFIDFQTGSTLHLTGTARVDWDPARVSAFPAAQRVVDVDIQHALQLDNRVPIRWELQRLSKFNPPLGGG